jgi:hypothetical protein
MKTETCVANATTSVANSSNATEVSLVSAAFADWNTSIKAGNTNYPKRNPKVYSADGTLVTAVTANETYFITSDVAIAGQQIDVSANTFPGTYYVTGDTYVRSEASGDDEYFQFIIPKAKVTPESNTITLEAEGDPSVFNMNLKVLRPKDGVMMKLVKYNLTSTSN